MQEGGGDEGGRTTGAKADFCLTAADTMLAGEKEKTPEEEEQLEGREVEEAMVGLEGTTARGQEVTLMRHLGPCSTGQKMLLMRLLSTP